MKSLRLLVIALVLSARAFALGLQDLPFGPIVPVNRPISVDGKLDDWKAVAGNTYSPLSMLVSAGGDAGIASLLSDPISVNVKFCYDSDALYMAVDWKDRNPGVNQAGPGDADHWFEKGEGFELHLLTDRVVHIACWPAAGGAISVMARYDGETAWHDVSKIVTAAGAPNGKGFAQELRIPWSAVTSDGKMPPTATMEMGVDFAWNAIPPALLPRLRAALSASLQSARGVPVSFVTAAPHMAAAGYLPNPAQWGDLALGGTASGDQAMKSADGTTSLQEMPVPLASAPPAADGGSTGWDTSLFQASSYLNAFWGERFTSRIAAQYDDANLYLAVHSPSYAPDGGPSNLMPESTQQGFNGGDALQIRLSDGKMKVSLCGWYDTAGGKAALTSDGKELPTPFLLQEGASEHFQVDGSNGFTQQITIPWKLLFGAAPKPGTLKGTFQFWYVDLTPRFSLHSKLLLQRQAALSVSYRMPAAGAVTVGLYDHDGTLLKWIAQDVYRYAGENHEPWDGLDQWGKPVPAGSYSLKAIYHPPITTDYKASVCNPGTPPWPTPDDKGDWLGDESNPQAAATDGKWVFLGCPDSEKGFGIIGVDETGQRQWSYVTSSDTRCVSLAVDGDFVYAVYSGPERTGTRRVFLGKDSAIERAILVCLDKKTGKPAKFSKTAPLLQVTTWPYREDYRFLWDLRNNKTFSPATYGGQPRYFASEVGETTSALGIAAAGGRIYISLFYDNKLLVADPETGKALDEIPLPAPASLHALDDHTLLAVSGNQIVRVDLATKTVTPLISAGLSAPFGVTSDKTGNVYVSDWGTSFQVKVFNGAGRFLRAIGKEGGRPWVGKWDPSGMLVPRGIAVTDDGKLWVAEDDGMPKRVSVWDATSGALLKDYIGPTPYGGGTSFWADPNDATLIHAVGTLFKVDYAGKAYTPQSIDYRHVNHDDPFTPNGDGGGAPCQVLSHGGHQYVVTSIGSFVTVLQRQGDIYRAVAAVGSVHHDSNPALNKDGTEEDAWDSDIGHHAYAGYFPDCFKGHGGDNYSWTDDSGDNLVQPSEMHWVTTLHGGYEKGAQPSLGAYWGAGISQGWSIFMAGSFHDCEVIYRIDLKGWTPAGAPIYDIAGAKPIVFLPSGYSISGLFVTKDDKLVVSFNYEAYGKSPDSFGCYDLDGKKLWAIARPLPFREPSRQQYLFPHANNAVFDFNTPKLGDVFGTWLWHGAARPYLITSDGLYVSTLFEDTMLGPTALWGESFTYYFQGPDGTPYAVNGASQAEHIFEIKGLRGDNTGRFEGTYSLTDADVQKAQAMREVPEVKPPPKPVVGVAWLKQPPNVDGDLSDWNLSAGVSLDGGNGRSAEVALGRDAANLYLAYKVHEANPMRNGGGSWQTLFVSGDCVDLMLQTNPKADPNRRNAVEGDERLLFSMLDGKPVAVLYKPVVPGTASPVHLAATQIDQIIQLDSAKVAIKPDAGHGFYTVEASVPLQDLGIDPKGTDDLRGDVGVVFADESGKSRSLRLYYYNHDTEMVNDLPTEATLQPGEWGKITMPLGPNLLLNGGFESPFVDSRDQPGWFINAETNGSDAVLSTESPYTGHQSLLMETQEPLSLPPEAYKALDRRPFLQSAGGGKGPAVVTVSQQVPVTAGHQYSFRYHYRCEDFQSEVRAPGPPGSPTGYVSFGARLSWICPPPYRGSSASLGGTDYGNPTQFEWKTIRDWSHGWDLPRPYTAPEGATAAVIVFNMATAAPNHTPRLFIDDAEFVDLTTP